MRFATIARSVNGALKQGVALGATALLLACATPPAVPLRDPAAPFGATTRFDAAAFAGDWRIASSSDAHLAGTLKVQAGAGALQLDGAIAGAYAVATPGVLTGPDGTRLVVMWLDEEARTAVLGRGDGSAAFVLSRNLPVPADKRAAAFEILDFYGWDTARMENRT